MATAYAIPNIAGYPFNILPDLSSAKVRERLSPPPFEASFAPWIAGVSRN